MLRKKTAKFPNAATIIAMKQLDAGKGTRFADAEALFKELGIWPQPPASVDTAKRED
jgi:hypothetical protein